MKQASSESCFGTVHFGSHRSLNTTAILQYFKTLPSSSDCERRVVFQWSAMCPRDVDHLDLRDHSAPRTWFRSADLAHELGTGVSFAVAEQSRSLQKISKNYHR